jgi:RNA polymerase sigma factor (sigma-70 family)
MRNRRERNRSSVTDADLVCRARQGDPEAFTELVERYRDAIYGLAFHYLHDFEDARDVAQEVFLQAYLHLDQLRDPARFGPWLRQVTVNQCRMWRRQRPREEPLEGRPETAASREPLETQLAVRQALFCLSEASRLTLILFYMQGRSLREIAAFLDVPVTTVKSRLRNARARLRKELVEMVQDTLTTKSLPADFATNVRQMLHGKRVISVAFSPNGRLLASGSLEGPVKLWDAESGTLLRTLTGHTNLVDDLCFSPAGQLLASAGADWTLRLWDTDTGRLWRTLGDGERIYSLAFSPDGGTLAHGSCRFADNFDIVRSRVVLRRVAPGEALGEVIGELTSRLWDAPPEMLAAAPGETRGMIYAVTFSPDRTRLATGNSVVEDGEIVGGEVSLWDARTLHRLSTISAAGFMVKSVAFSPDGRIITGGGGLVRKRDELGAWQVASQVQLWEAESGAVLRTLAREDGPSMIQRVVFSPDGQRLVVYRYREGIKDASVWDVHSGKLLQAFPGAGEVQGVVAFSSDGSSLASVGSGRSVLIWRVG